MKKKDSEVPHSRPSDQRVRNPCVLPVFPKVLLMSQVGKTGSCERHKESSRYNNDNY